MGVWDSCNDRMIILKLTSVWDFPFKETAKRHDSFGGISLQKHSFIHFDDVQQFSDPHVLWFVGFKTLTHPLSQWVRCLQPWQLEQAASLVSTGMGSIGGNRARASPVSIRNEALWRPWETRPRFGPLTSIDTWFEIATVPGLESEGKGNTMAALSLTNKVVTSNALRACSSIASGWERFEDLQRDFHKEEKHFGYGGFGSSLNVESLLFWKWWSSYITMYWGNAIYEWSLHLHLLKCCLKFHSFCRK